MRIPLLLPALALPAAMLLGGCAQEASRDHVVGGLLHSEAQVFPDEAVWVGDSDGYHYIHVRNIYCFLGDKDYKVPVSQWNLPDPFPLTDDASQWRNVKWEDKGVLERSRFAYVLVDPRERIDSPSVRAPETQPGPAATQP